MFAQFMQHTITLSLVLLGLRLSLALINSSMMQRPRASFSNSKIWHTTSHCEVLVDEIN